MSRKKKSDKKKRQRSTLTASTADKHKLYEEAVQSPESEVDFVDRVYKKKYGRHPSLYREDFCGTGLSSCAFVRKRVTNRAIGVDLDAEVLAWGREHNFAWISEAERERVQLIEGNVLSTDTEKADALVAMNFSYYLFKTRADLAGYFRKAKSHLAEEGLFICDCYGGYEAQDVLEEPRDCGGYTYIWDQADFNPITSEALCHIHFHFPDGTKMKKAFTYHWRLWTIAEIRELMDEAGFSNTTVYWEGADDDGDGNGIFRPSEKGEVCAGWIAYIVAEP